ncbi:RNA helicase Mov10l1-like isoform X2 [Dendronephthya gigantea]|nr:RNA helicase Mov10l1-like isoform X2 [Dendronephthya gigantea]
MLGEFTQLVVFNFGNFQIGRFFKANVRDEQQNLLDARTPYHYHKRSVVSDNDKLQGWVVPGERRMFKQKTINISTKLGKYEVPRTLKRCILNKMDLCCLVPSLAEPLIVRNYKERFSALLHAEEVQMEMEMREFDLQQVSLKPAGKLLSLAVPGLAEGRPSLLIGDRVILSVSGGSNNSPRYEGFIHEVLGTEVLLKFHEDFHVTYDMDSYDVMFFFNRTPLRRCHKAVETAKFLADQVLFPNEVLIKLPQELVKNDKGLFNSKLNERQRAAVSRILIGQCRPMPYVLFGPPGTGKTVTLVEAILQIFHRIRCSRILACAPSNSAADLIAERLHHSGAVSEGDMVRLNAFQRQQNLPEDIENYSTNIDKLDVAAHYRIVICTCTTSGQLQTLGLAPGHFTHVIIDEAGQATEPESLVPISFLTGTEGQIILGGDPYQLGAVLRSPISQTYGLSISLLERLMTRIPYQRDESKFSNHGSYDPLLVTKLINNYRSHEALLELPSRLFYHSEMVTCAEDSVKNSLCCWDTLPNKNGFPILFHGIKGEDLREGNSPSWFNAVEAVQVIRYVQELRKFKKHPVQLSDIGIITPYRKQVEKIRLLLDRLGMSEIKVGSVEEFQGQERLVIIISTVRSCETLIAFDYTHNIGFLSNPKRFNVAITRAQALMIVIGNPHVLVKDSNWRALLQYCLENKSYLGCDLPFLNEHIENDDCFESCEETRRNDGQVDGDCEIHEHDEFIRSRNINIQQKDTVEGILGNHIERDMDPLKIHHAPGNGRLTDDTAGDCTSGKNGIDCKTCSNIGGILVEKVGVNGIPMDTLEIDRVEKSKGDASCNSMNELVVERPRSGSAVDSEGILIDKLGICDEEISKRDNAGHCCVNRYSEPKTLESNSIFRSEMLWSGHATKSSEFSSAIRNDKVARGINCSDSETSSRSVVECQDNESSDEDIEEIVYKGEME